MSLRKRILKNGLAAALQKIAKIAEQLILVPLFIKYWGAEYYGEWLTITIIPTFLGLADFGFGTAVSNTFLLKYSSGDKQGASDIATTGVRVLSFFIIFAIFLSIIILIIVHKLNIFDSIIIKKNDALIAVFIMLSARTMNFYQQVYEAFYRSARKADVSINFQTLFSFLNIILGIIVLILGGKIVEYSLVSLIVAVITNPVYIYVAINTLGLHKEYEGKFLRNEVNDLMNKGIGYFLSPIWQAIYFQGSTLVVHLMLGPLAVTIFNTVRTLIRASGQAFAMLIIAGYPDFQFEIGAGNIEKAKQIFLKLLGLNIIVSIFFILGLTIVGQSLYNWWTNNVLEVSFNVWIVFISSIIFYAIWFTISFIFEATNNPYKITIPGLCFSIISIMTSWVLCYKLDILGVAIGNLTFDILMCIYLLPKGSSMFNLRPLSFLEESIASVRFTFKKEFIGK